ncbi:MAG: hypothetical protein PHS93_06500 [Candidatus Omnitrophica bacterium]|nr:hypothetical protein [Candidatus Omnitrophota bacterium]MDD5352799.1 hypothetical protein [Candidatus Omnitrophota bacterium]MDD5550398.1 hypothetical protein [Candidatus Omnitrophota bacterium]
MRMSKIIIINFTFVIFALLHVFLQTEITKLGYEIKRNEDKFQRLVDNNNILKYNIYALESPHSLDKYVSLNNSKLKILKPVQVFGLYPKAESKYVAENKSNNLLSNNAVLVTLRKIFASKQAEAKTIK